MAGGRQALRWASASAGSNWCYLDPKAGVGSILESRAAGLAHTSWVVVKMGWIQAELSLC